MVEELGSVIQKGFDTWKANLSICLPFVFSAILTFAVAIILLGGAVLVAIPSLPSLPPYLINPEAITPELILSLTHQFAQHIGIIIAAVIITAILALLISAYFTAGAIGMAKVATQTGKTDMSDMKDYGRRKFISLLFADIIVGLITLVGLVFLIPGILYALPLLATISEPTPEVFLPAFATFMIGLLIMCIYMIIISILFALTRYAVVIDDLGAIDGVKKGFYLFRDHKVDVFLLWLVALVISLVVSVILGLIPFVGQFLNIAISIIVIQPLIFIWWSRFYMSLTTPETDELTI